MLATGDRKQQMVWDAPDGALVEFVNQRQRVAIRTYEVNPDLVREHIGQEDSFRTGGYGERQISEMLQNAVDALGIGAGAGRVEFRMADGALYCANEGSSFSESGILAVCYAFLSSKRGDEIGRFGLGFKSVLGVCDKPQIFSRSVSFEFNSPSVEALFSNVSRVDGKLPLLRIPNLIDASSEAERDPHLKEMMTWASSVIKLPLTQDGPRLRKELLEFDSQSLLFMKNVSEVVVSLQKADGKVATRIHRRESTDEDGKLLLHSPDVPAVEWLFAERTYFPDEAVRGSLADTARRMSMTVSYAVPLGGGGRDLGRLWAWFPLKDETTARGIFNAPWQVNDDRTSLLATSALNGALLDVCAELFVDVALRASTSEDPAAHLDLFPARGREPRSAADMRLSMRIPELARDRAVIPDAEGVLRTRREFRDVPDLATITTASGSLRPSDIEAWNAVVGNRSATLHPANFQNPRIRLNRLRSLFRQDDGDVLSKQEVALATWLEIPSRSSDPRGLVLALALFSQFRQAGVAPSKIERSNLIPVEGGGWSPMIDAPRILLPGADATQPAGITLVSRTHAKDPDTGKALRALGLRQVSADEIVRAKADLVRDSWGAGDWSSLWGQLLASSSTAAKETLTRIRERGKTPRIENSEGDWVPATTLLVGAAAAFAVRHRRVSEEFDTRLDLLVAAGCLSGPVSDYPIATEELYAAFKQTAIRNMEKQLSRQGQQALTISLGQETGIGPLDVLDDVVDDQTLTAAWTEKLLSLMPRREMTVVAQLKGGKTASLPMPTPEWWAIRTRGKVQTSRGFVPVGDVVSSKLARFMTFLPVVVNGTTGVHVEAARELAAVPDSVLADYFLDESVDSSRPSDLPIAAELMIECARRSGIQPPATILAQRGDVVVRVRRDGVVVAESTEDQTILHGLGEAFLPVVEDLSELTRAWGLQTSSLALARSIDIREGGREDPLMDLYPTLGKHVAVSIDRLKIRRSSSIVQKVLSPSNGIKETRLPSARFDDVLIVDESLDDLGVLEQVVVQFEFHLSRFELQSVLDDDEKLRHSELIARARAASDLAEKLLILVGPKNLKKKLPSDLLAAVEAKKGRLTDGAIAELYLKVRGFDALNMQKEPLKDAGLVPPGKWAGSPRSQSFVMSLGFPVAYAGSSNRNPPDVTRVPGRVDLAPLHDFQQDLAVQVRDLALNRLPDGDAQRGLLYLPTGAGKTRVTVQAIAQMLLAQELTGPILWIAQSEELCEQAIQTWTDVWRAFGDERPLDLCRFWTGHTVELSPDELQVVVAIDDTLSSVAGSALKKEEYDWLSRPSLVVIDEAHTAGSPTYTRILEWLGLTARKTERPLLGLTATPYRGRNKETNESFVARFGQKKLESLDPDDPLGELRRKSVLSEVDHEVLDGMSVSASQADLSSMLQMKEVTRSMLDQIGQDLGRTQGLVDDILRRDPEWPILVFAASVASAYTIAALLQLEGREAAAVDGNMRPSERRRVIDEFKRGSIKVLVNCDLLTQGFDAPKVRALYIARPTFSPNRYVQMLGRGLRGPLNGGNSTCLIVNVQDTFSQFGTELAYKEFDYLWEKR